MIYIGSDHAGYDLKEVVKVALDEAEREYVDLGVFTTDSADYPDVAREVAEKVSENAVVHVGGAPDTSAMGILICGTGTGMVMAANKLDGIRAASVTNETLAEMARRHNDANIITLGSRIVDKELAVKLVNIFLSTPFDGDERHQKRIAKITEIEQSRDKKKN